MKVSTRFAASGQLSAASRQGRPSQSGNRSTDVSVRRSDSVVFGKGAQRGERGVKIRTGLAARTIGLLAPIMAVTGCSIPIPGKPSPETPQDPSAIPSTTAGATAGTQAGSGFFDEAMTLNGGSSPSTPPVQTTSPPEPTPTTMTTPPPTEPATPPVTTPNPPPADSSDTNPATQGWVNLMTQNVWGINHPGAAARWEARIATVADIVKSNDIEIVALQEAKPPQNNRLMKLLGGNYRMYPGKYVHKDEMSQRAIVYKVRSDDGKPLWQLKDHGILYIPTYKDNKITQHTGAMPWGQFVHAETGQEVVFASVHAVAWDKHLDPGGARKREKAGHRMADWAREKKAKYPDALVVLTGDINQRDYFRSKDRAMGGDRQRIIPCIVGKELRAVDDLQANRKGTCPINKSTSDQGYSNSTEARGYRHINKKQSDHAAVLFKLKLFAKKVVSGN